MSEYAEYDGAGLAGENSRAEEEIAKDSSSGSVEENDIVTTNELAAPAWQDNYIIEETLATGLLRTF